ncbi:serine/threonine protein kinase [Fusarium oxysporum f. sp. radicis-lycopersici 26381]|uniref:Serine/threonine protein kinase n=1 Tax=Fusarium oxysporum Fo47 TaxID=660027 RepID=W9JK43_FUSOX|nr:serine/threonine protein kinase [Fusarium oxysporum Fo47]EXL45745.1 serine/threonine protein kinase [Fusarium oxysporum f. sp. radicis-lycopersici 26381]
MVATPWTLLRFLDECENAEKKNSSDEAFISTTTIKLLTSKECVSDILKERNCPNQDVLKKRIYDRRCPAKIIFLILARADMLDRIGEFLSNDFSDHHLPIEVLWTREGYKLKRAKDIDWTTAPFGAGIHYRDVDYFTQKQWPFLAPIFKREFEYVLQQGIPLPLVEKGNAIVSGFSSVSKIKMHHAHVPEQIEHSMAMKKMELESEDQIKYVNKEMTNVKSLRLLDHDHLVKAILACTRGKQALFFFPWAKGGDLYNFLKSNSNEGMAAIIWMLDQMVGLCSALSLLADKGYRHGDLKPANILLFPEKSGSYRLKITDVGLSKLHILATSRRLNGTTAKATTRRYSPPEFDLLFDDDGEPVEDSDDIKLSRKFDVWSLGCVFIEFLIWAKLGRQKYKEFDRSMKRDRRFWDSGRKDLDDKVKERIQNLEDAVEETPGDKVVQRVLELALKQMLLVDSDDRSSASDIHKELESIRDSYSECFQPKDELDLPLGLTTEQDADTQDEGLHTKAEQQSAKLLNQWTVNPDNEFAKKFFSETSSPSPADGSRLCDSCLKLYIWEPNATISGRMRDFQTLASTCDMCNLLYAISQRLGLEEDQELHCIRDGSTFKLKGRDGPPILSLFSDPAYNSDDLGSVQVGYPTLSPPESPERYRLFQKWLYVCDNEHGHARDACSGGCAVQMPTRLIYVGESSEHLEDIKDSGFLRYLALSHCWGGSTSLSTLTSNIDKFRSEIPHEQLPINFQEAIKVTRALKIPYLWIDSLCIIQDDPEDWRREAARMGQVFSNAYCTIAATSAAASNEGFLTPKLNSALSATLKTPEGGLLHISEFMENCNRDLESAPLNTRGWVMQERALSRRTLHFTKTQVYWECGNGLHCERLFKLSNPQSALFADSDFPKAILKYYKGGRITLFQNLYEKYSRLNFSYTSDRPVAILGLEKHLSSVLQTRGESGVFEQYLARSLLWSRPENIFLNSITFQDDYHVPSWSWMAYEGPITYANIPFDEVEWSTDCLLRSGEETGTNSKRTVLKAVARDLKLDKLDMHDRVKIDEGSGFELSNLRGVVLGKDKKRESRVQVYYVLLVTLSEDEPEQAKVYVRVGVAWLLEHNIAMDGEDVVIY